MAVTTEKFCLQWNEFQANLKTSYRGIRKTEDFSDVTLACEDGQQIEAHRVILSSSSLYFRDLLARNPARSHPLIYMRGIKFSDLSAIVDFIYHGEAEVMKDQLETFLEIAGELSVKGMTKQVGKQRRKAEAVEVADDEIDETEKILKIDEQVDSVADESLDENEDASMNNKETFSCDQCGKTLGSIGSLRTHMYNHKKKAAGGSDVKTEPSYRDASDDSLVQDSDSEEGGRLALLDRTVGDNTELEARIDAITERRDGLWTCTQCGKTDGSRFHLRRHVETHIEGFSHPCSSCDKAFPQRALLKAHVLRAHPEEKMPKPFSCDLCGLPAKSAKAVVAHKQRKHKD